MNILWDFRLFSLGYSGRGVGAYTLAVARVFSDMETSSEIFIWGDKNSVPELMGHKKVRWIQYQWSDWKQDLIRIPLIIRRYKIDIFHYWIALGPLRQIGMGMFHRCKTVATIYDLGVENWDVPFLKSVKSSRYWQIQKKLIRSIDKIICISEATARDVEKMLPSLSQKMEVIYKPVLSLNKERNDSERQQYFITLGGSVHKNTSRVVKAFDLFRRKMPDCQLKILGQVDKQEEDLWQVPQNVTFESMDNYKEHLENCSGLIFCSIYEGFGIPPVEGMECGCPLLLSDIESLHETCHDAAVFVDPLDVEKIAEGMMKLIMNKRLWSLRSFQGASAYESKTSNTGTRLLEVYNKVWVKR